MTQASIDLSYIATYSGKNNERRPVNPDKNLIRYEFLECMVRCCKDKYVRYGGMKTVTEGMEQMLKDHIMPHAKRLNPH